MKFTFVALILACFVLSTLASKPAKAAAKEGVVQFQATPAKDDVQASKDKPKRSKKDKDKDDDDDDHDNGHGNDDKDKDKDKDKKND